MSTKQSTCAALVVALGFAVAAVSCGGDDSTSKPVQDVTFLMVDGGGDSKAAFGWNKDSGWNIAQVRATDKVNMALSGSVAGSGGFSGALAGGGTFSGSPSGATATFSADIGGSGTFTGSAILTATCSVDDLCQFAALLCGLVGSDAQAQADQSCTGFSVAQCDAAVSQGDFADELRSAVGGDEAAAAIICAVIDFFGCIGRNATSLNDISDATAQACAESSGLIGAFDASAQQ
jgi:hypothetical protein